MTLRPASPEMHRGRLFRKYLTLILSLVTTVLLVSSGINLYFSYQENRAALASLQHEKAIAAASRIEQYVRQISQQLAYAALPQLDAGDVEMRRVEFLKLLRQAPEITDIALLDAEGKERNAVSRLGMDVTGSGRDRSSEPAFINAKRGQPWYGPVYFRKETEPYMTVAIRSGGEKGPVTVAEVNLKFIWDVVSRIKIGDKGKAYVVDATGQLVADPDIGLVLRKTSLAGLVHVKAAAVAGNGAEPAMVSKDLAGTTVLTSAAPIAALDWRVFVEQPVAEVYAKLDASILRTGLLLLAGLAISALAASALARSMVRPIRTLDEGARRIGAGELDQRIVIETGDELEGLADQFNRMTAQLRESYAGLERKVDERTAEVTEALDYQTAISDVLRVISESPTDVAPVFEAILDSAQRLLGSPVAAVHRFDGRLLHLAATRNFSAEALELSARMYPGPPDPRVTAGRVLLEGRTVCIDDTLADPGYASEFATAGRWRRILGTPLLKDGAPLGVLSLAWPEPGQTPQRQIDLLKTFADQAVIAIENVRLINETKEALEQQTATAEILRVISGSITDTQPVFDAIVQSCQRLFGGKAVALTLPTGAMIHSVAFASDRADLGEGGFLKPWPLDRGSGAGTCLLESRVVVVADTVEGAKRFPRMHDLALALGYHSALFVPLLREAKAIGCLAILRAATGEFDDREIALAQTFADQAVIAIENVRLFNETKEALHKVEERTAELTESLEYQTAISEVLRVISESPTDVTPVFEAIMDSAQRLFGSPNAAVFRYDGRLLHLVANSNWPAEAIEDARRTYPGLPNPAMLTGRIILSGQPHTIVDTQADPEYDQTTARAGTWRRMIGAPMLKDGAPIGVLVVAWPNPGQTPQKQADLLKTFADQAAIAIENVRLINETKEALEQQTATAEVLKAISRTTFELDPVLDALIENATRLCKSDRGFVFIREGDAYRPAANFGASPEQLEFMRSRPLTSSSGTLVGRAALTRQVVHIEDAKTDPMYEWNDALALLGFRTMLGVPMLREGEPIGVVAIWRDQVRPFSARDTQLVTSFADQAVIAIENVRLFREIKAKSRELEIANQHKSEFLANMSHELRTPLNAIIGFSEVLIERMFGELNEKQDDYLKDIHSSGRHLLTLINDILDLSKIEAGRMELDLGSFDAAAAMGNAMTLVRERAQRHGIALSLEADGLVGEGLGEIRADERKFKQILLNLLTNAVKFTPDGGKIVVRARRMAGGIEVAVSDTGIGISNEDQAVVFDEFRQVGRHYTNKQEGTGLGLTLTKRFVELHGGTLRLESVPGQGSTFTFTLPSQA